MRSAIDFKNNDPKAHNEILNFIDFHARTWNSKDGMVATGVLLKLIIEGPVKAVAEKGQAKAFNEFLSHIEQIAKEVGYTKKSQLLDAFRKMLNAACN